MNFVETSRFPELTPIMKFIEQSRLIAVMCVEYNGPVTMDEILNSPGMQSVVREALVDARVLVPRCRCVGDIALCSCDFPRDGITVENRMLHVLLSVKWGRDFKAEFLKLEGAREMPGVVAFAETQLVRHGGVNPPGATVEEFIRANFELMD
jgi:hypothetical protein